MKNLLKRSWWQAILVAWLVLVVSGGVAYAAYYGISKTIAATVTVADVITLPSDTIGVYSDAAGTANLTSLNFGKVPPPTWGSYWRRVSVMVYVKNQSNTVGLEPVKLFVEVYSQNFQYGRVWVDKVWNAATDRWEFPSLLPGEIKPVLVNLEIYKEAPLGSNNFIVVFDGKGASAPDVMPPLAVEEKPQPVVEVREVVVPK